MTGRQFYDWQTAGGADDVMRVVDALERAELHWCAIGGIAVNHWAAHRGPPRTEGFATGGRDPRDQSVTRRIECRPHRAERG
jgi:hypothetical protein